MKKNINYNSKGQLIKAKKWSERYQGVKKNSYLSRQLSTQFSKKNDELKFYDSAAAGLIQIGAQIIDFPINDIPQGTGESQRIGRKCVIKSIQIQGVIQNSSFAESDFFRFYLILDKQCNGAIPEETEIINIDNLTSFNNLPNNQRFVILKSWKISSNSDDVTTDFDSNTRHYGVNIMPFKYYTKCNIPLEFKSTTGVITELTSNNLFYMCHALVGDVVTYTLQTRIRFSD